MFKVLTLSNFFKSLAVFYITFYFGYIDHITMLWLIMVSCEYYLKESNSNEPIKVTHHWKLVNQPILYDAHLTEVTKILKFLNDLKNNKKKKQKQNRKQEKLWSFSNSTNVLFGRKIWDRYNEDIKKR